MRSTLVTIQVLLICAATVFAKEPRTAPQPANTAVCAASFWKPDSKVEVYFLRDLFTAEQRHAVLETMHNSQEAARKVGLAVTFNYAGETDGLIDCENCLTVARQTYSHHRKGQTVIHSLRRNYLGNLVSAWIEIDLQTNSQATLRGYVLEALRGGRGTKALSICRR